MWMLLMLLSSELSLDAKKPVETFYQTQEQCEKVLKKYNDGGNYNGFCSVVFWK